MEPQPRYCLLDCEDAEKWRGHEALFHVVMEPEAHWDQFRCWAGELPPLETLGRYRAVIISGGHYSAYEDRQWIQDLAAWLGRAVRQHPGVRFLGVCFGCQILARALGGEVGKNPSRHFVLKVEQLRLTPGLQRDPAYLQALADVATGREAKPPAGERPAGAQWASAGVGGDAERPGTAGVPEGGAAASGAAAAPTSSGSAGLIRLIQSHGDQVLALPAGAAALAESDTARYEIWGWGGNVLAVQGHAELTPGEVMEKIHPAITAAGRLTPEESAEAARSLTTDLLDSQLVLRLMRRFAERGLTCCPPLPASTAAEAAGMSAEEQAAGVAAGVAAAAEASAVTAEMHDAVHAPLAGGQRAVRSSEGSVEPGASGDAMPMPTAEHAARAKQAAAAAGLGSGAAGVEEAERALRMLGLGAKAELDKVPSEYRHLQGCNAAAEERYTHMAQVVVQANRVLQAVQEQQSALAPALDAIGALEAQVSQLEGVMLHMEATASRLQHNLDGLRKH